MSEIIKPQCKNLDEQAEILIDIISEICQELNADRVIKHISSDLSNKISSEDYD